MNVKINSESTEIQQQTTSFSDQNANWNYSVNTALDSAHRTVDTNDADLNNFFSRPIKIASINWTVGATFGTTINPWQLYFENLRVINRITNYNVLRSKLCVRIMINGNGFHYGRALASYRPLHNDDQMIAWRYGLVPQDTIAASQRMHVWLDPTKSQGGTLTLPYVYYKNAMNIPEQDWRNMGELDIASVTTLQHANGGTDSVTLSVFAWAEDVALSMPTVAEPGALAPQSVLDEHSEYDQINSGPISSVSNTVARIAGTLSAVPQIAPLAKATEMAASGVANIAKLFGMSRPVDAGPINSYKPMYTGNLANTNVMDTSTKLTLDVRQELTIDPVATGLGPDDEMAISSLVQRESYLTQFQWQTIDVPETLLWNSYVTPTLFDTAAPSGFTEYHYTPVGYVARPFENWRGSLKFRFQVVASSFHKGRLKIVYDPYFNSTSEYNVQYTHIIDLATERDFTVEIGWGQEYSYLDHSDNGALGVPFSTSLLGGARHGQANGVIAVYVVNDLTTPSATLDDVSILVSVSAADDFELINPNGTSIKDVTFWQPQSLLWEEQADVSVPDGDLTFEESKPMEAPVDHVHGVQNVELEATSAVYFADPVSSIRQLLKRYATCRTWGGTETFGTVGARMTLIVPNFPFYIGYDPNGIDNAALPLDPTPYTYGKTIPLHYFTPLFLCRRGGLRQKYIHVSSGTSSDIMSVARNTEHGSTGYVRGLVSTIDNTSASSAAFQANSNSVSASASGAHVTHVGFNPTLEVELPYQTNLRFTPARWKTLIQAANVHSHAHTLRYPLGTVAGQTQVQQWTSVGEDFSLSFFQACPVFWVENRPTPSITA